MKTYTLSGADAAAHRPDHPERTARRYYGGMNFDVTFKVWPSRAALTKTVELQARRESRTGDWRPCIALRCAKCSRTTDDAGKCPTHDAPAHPRCSGCGTNDHGQDVICPNRPDDLPVCSGCGGCDDCEPPAI